MSGPWDDAERVDELKRRYLVGESAAQIARALSPGWRGSGSISRNAVIGIIHRKGFRQDWTPRAPRVVARTERPRAAPAPKASRREAAPRDPRAEAFVPPVETLTPTASVLSLSARGQCRWPIGEPGEDSFGLCGRACGEATYCPTHRAGAHSTPVYQRRSAKELERSLRRYIS